MDVGDLDWPLVDRRSDPREAWQLLDPERSEKGTAMTAAKDCLETRVNQGDQKKTIQVEVIKGGSEITSRKS